MNRIDVSVIIPTYNRAAMVTEAVASCLAQGLDSIEVVVVDDGSTDNTAEALASLPPSVELLQIEHCGNPSRVRNHGLARARGDLIAFLDSDDLFLPEKLLRQSAALDDHDAGLAYSDGIFFADSPDLAIGRVLDGLPSPTGDALPDLVRGNFLFPATVLTRRRIVEEAGGFDQRLPPAEDYDLWLRIAARHDFVFVPGELAAVRRHPASASHNVATVRRAAIAALDELERRFPDRAAELSEALGEGYARNHAAVAAACLTQRHWASALTSATAAARYALRNPLRSLRAFGDWRRRKRLRSDAAQPPANRNR